MRRTPIQVTQDILRIARHRPIKRTPLQRKSNLSTKRFNQYYEDLYYKGLIDIDDTAHVYVTDKGCIFLEKSQQLNKFMNEFGFV